MKKLHESGISKKAFDAYERVRRSGVTNMWNVSLVCELADISEEAALTIMRQYVAIRDFYYQEAPCSQ